MVRQHLFIQHFSAAKQLNIQNTERRICATVGMKENTNNSNSPLQFYAIVYFVIFLTEQPFTFNVNVNFLMVSQPDHTDINTEILKSTFIFWQQAIFTLIRQSCDAWIFTQICDSHVLIKWPLAAACFCELVCSLHPEILTHECIKTSRNDSSSFSNLETGNRGFHLLAEVFMFVWNAT